MCTYEEIGFLLKPIVDGFIIIDLIVTQFYRLQCSPCLIPRLSTLSPINVHQQCSYRSKSRPSIVFLVVYRDLLPSPVLFPGSVTRPENHLGPSSADLFTTNTHECTNCSRWC